MAAKNYPLGLQIGNAELDSRVERITQAIAEKEAQAAIFFNTTSIFYLSHFYFIATERPAALVVTREGKTTLFVPRLEEEHVGVVAHVGRAVSYPEYPSDLHPMLRFAALLKEMGLERAHFLSDAPGYASGWGYAGPALAEVLPQARFSAIPKLVEGHRVIKSQAEIALIRESCKWGNLAHELLQQYCAPGLSELEVEQQASQEATRAMFDTYGRLYRPLGPVAVYAGFRGQVGANAALPHAVTINARMQPGDVLVTGAYSAIGGYVSELERTMFVGEPGTEQRRLFDLMVLLQEVAFEAIRPGVPCSAVDQAVRAVYEREKLWPYWRHHVGHALGLLAHEAPFFDIGDTTLIEPGMVFSVEPGLYVPGLGGYRHSDTVLVTETGLEMLTYYPRDLESLIIPV